MKNLTQKERNIKANEILSLLNGLKTEECYSILKNVELNIKHSSTLSITQPVRSNQSRKE